MHRIDAGESAPEISEALSAALPTSSATEGMAEAMMLAHEACKGSVTGKQAIRAIGSCLMTMVFISIVIVSVVIVVAIVIAGLALLPSLSLFSSAAVAAQTSLPLPPASLSPPLSSPSSSLVVMCQVWQFHPISIHIRFGRS